MSRGRFFARLQTAQIETAFIDSGKPWQNGADESFNGNVPWYFSLQWFGNRAEAKVSIEECRRHYNDVRPHSSLGYLTPAAFKRNILPALILSADMTKTGGELTDPITAVLQ